MHWTDVQWTADFRSGILLAVSGAAADKGSCLGQGQSKERSAMDQVTLLAPHAKDGSNRKPTVLYTSDGYLSVRFRQLKAAAPDNGWLLVGIVQFAGHIWVSVVY